MLNFSLEIILFYGLSADGARKVAQEIYHYVCSWNYHNYHTEKKNISNFGQIDNTSLNDNKQSFVIWD